MFLFAWKEPSVGNAIKHGVSMSERQALSPCAQAYTAACDELAAQGVELTLELKPDACRDLRQRIGVALRKKSETDRQKASDQPEPFIQIAFPDLSSSADWATGDLGSLTHLRTPGTVSLSTRRGIVRISPDRAR